MLYTRPTSVVIIRVLIIRLPLFFRYRNQRICLELLAVRPKRKRWVPTDRATNAVTNKWPRPITTSVSETSAGSCTNTWWRDFALNRTILINFFILFSLRRRWKCGFQQPQTETANLPDQSTAASELERVPSTTSATPPDRLYAENITSTLTSIYITFYFNINFYHSDLDWSKTSQIMSSPRNLCHVQYIFLPQLKKL